MPQNESVRQLLRDAFVPLALMFLASRVVLLLIAWIAVRTHSSEGFDSSLTSLLCHWDCRWYVDIAAHGYSPVESGKVPGETNFGFYPLYPLLVRAISPLCGGNMLYSGLLLSNLCFGAALGYVYLYARALDLGRDVALASIALLCAFPQGIVFSAPYTESLCLLLLAAAMYHLRRGQFLASGIAAALLSAARPNGIFFVVLAITWLLHEGGLRAFLEPWRVPEKFIPIVLAPLGMFLFLGFCFFATGDAFAHASTELFGWGWAFTAPWENLPLLLRSGGNFQLCAIVSLAVAACSLLLLRMRLYEDFALCAASILLIWCGQGMVSVFRYWLVLFPIWIALARALDRRPLALASTCASLGILNGMTAWKWALGSVFAL